MENHWGRITGYANYQLARVAKEQTEQHGVHLCLRANGDLSVSDAAEAAAAAEKAADAYMRHFDAGHDDPHTKDAKEVALDTKRFGLRGMFRGQGIGMVKAVISLTLFHEGRLFLTKQFKNHNVNNGLVPAFE